jgi:hypothetical protein
MLGDSPSEDGVKRMMTQTGLVLPDSPAGKGKSWNSKVEGKMGTFGKMVVDTKFSYEGPETRGGKRLEKISAKPTVTLLVDDDAPVSMKIASQDSKGAAYFDNEAGRLVETTMTQNLEMEVTTMGQTFAQKLKNVTTMKLADKK